jgi:CubicO group peptidase (beta-lactamase class C family)
MVSGLVLFHLVDQGKLSLDSTTGTVLGWTGAKANITLRHLLSFTSGLAATNACTANPAITLAACVSTIAATTLSALPGKQFEYGPVHLAVAGRMAEVATGKSWNTLFSESVAQPLGLPSDVKYTTAPRSGTGTTNPLVAAGLQASMNEYRPLLATVFHEGSFGGKTIASRTLFTTQASEPFPTATIAGSPIADMGLPFHYGLAAWLECAPPANGCAVLSSPGAWGFTPWIDRDAGYYAIIGTFVNSSGENGVVDFSVDLAQDLKPEIRKALGK